MGRFVCFYRIEEYNQAFIGDNQDYNQALIGASEYNIVGTKISQSYRYLVIDMLQVFLIRIVLLHTTY